MNLKLLALAFFILAAVSVAKTNKVKEIKTRLTKLHKGIANLKTKMHKIIAVHSNFSKSNQGLINLKKKTGKLLLGMEIKMRSLEKKLAWLSKMWGKIAGIHPNVHRISKEIDILEALMDKVIGTPGKYFCGTFRITQSADLMKS